MRGIQTTTTQRFWTPLVQPTTETILKPIKLGKGLNFHCMLYGSDIVDINNGQTQESYNLSKNETERLYFGFGT